eukprot:TRINITY_DN14126_c0_g1_i3.p2 TRINITY_DN14126_c0_g1~~TRINITY_DN14126_c0_g1_i3.p2  ORF type:complete len:217 (-),score=84.73 TRINITY_DN14126_c0_g1_i3:152-802(-)
MRRQRREAEEEELQNWLRRLKQELQAGRDAGRRLEDELHMARRSAFRNGAELRSEEAAQQQLAAEAAAAEQAEEQLQLELHEERRKAEEARRVASALLEQRRRVSHEADEALRLCDAALDESRVSSEEVRVKDQQLSQSERSCELMQNTLAQRLAAVHNQVKEAEVARAAAALELREERLEHQQLRQQMLSENARRRARLNALAYGQAHAPPLLDR